MIKLYTNYYYPTEVSDVVKLFFPCEIVSDPASADIFCIVERAGNNFTATATFNGKSEHQTAILDAEELQAIRQAKRAAKVAVYNCLVAATGQKQAWGSLTGIRPTKLAYQLLAEFGEFKTHFGAFYGVSEAKIGLVEQILDQQSGLLTTAPSDADLYISVPFCLSRCSYCSFTAGEIGALKKYVSPYIELLQRDITETLDFAKKNGYNIKNVYFGGGTPTSLSVAELSTLLKCVSVTPLEYTVEAGRPDTITRDKLKLFADVGVNRISINPQTFSQRILDIVGRRHSVADVYSTYEMARQYSFDINMDLIAGLPSENYEEFCHSVDCCIDLAPENVTVHTLALKKGSKLKEDDYIGGEKVVSDMVDYSYTALAVADFRPYYMYRQKYMSQNLENVGYCRLGKQGRYNIDNMEETTSIFACGSGGISKRVFAKENRIERSANAKDVKSYIENFDTYLRRKFEMFAG
jgi:oxygen-independent coproporphyrinogen-3 oxidase